MKAAKYSVSKQRKADGVVGGRGRRGCVELKSYGPISNVLLLQHNGSFKPRPFVAMFAGSGSRIGPGTGSTARTGAAVSALPVRP